MSSDKKKSSNFSAREIGILVEEVAARKSILFAKFGSGVSSSTKIDAWQAIHERINSASEGEIRSVDSCKKKWYDLAS